MDIFTAILRFSLSILFGGLIGFERDRHGRAAGLRTNMLVCSGSALFTIISITISTVGDPGRIAAQIVSGIGFLGAGTIIKSGFSIRGLTTAACMWVVAAVGMATGCGMYEIASFCTIATLVIMIIAKYIENRVSRVSSLKLKLITNSMENIIQVEKACQEHHSVNITSMNTEYSKETGLHTSTFVLDVMSNVKNEKNVTLSLASTIEKIVPKLDYYRLECLN
ncbi:MAG: MgtC/SapB family protein [Lentisphaeria bacterium]